MSSISLMADYIFAPKKDEVVKFDDYSILFIEEGEGVFQVDFKNYHFTSGKIIFLAPKQYFQLLSGRFIIRVLKISSKIVQSNSEARYLFKHLIGIGYIELNTNFSENYKRYLAANELLDVTVNDWITQNPFSATRREVNILFNFKDYIDDNYQRPLVLKTTSLILKEQPTVISNVIKKKLKYTPDDLRRNKLLIESQRQIIFTNNSSKEIAYKMGFSSASYFNKFIKKYTYKTPVELRDSYYIPERNVFLQNLFELVNQHYLKEHFVSFYSHKMNMTDRSLSRKVFEKTGKTLSQIIKEKLLDEAKKMLANGASVNDVAFDLGFNEHANFTLFFRKNTGVTPSAFSKKKHRVQLLGTLS